MAKYPQKDKVKAEAVETAPVSPKDDWEDAVDAAIESKEEPAVEGMVQVLSMREGDIVLPEGTLKRSCVLKLTKERAKWLVASFPNEVKIV